MKKYSLLFCFVLLFQLSCSFFYTQKRNVYFEFNKEKKEIKIPLFKEIFRYEIPNDSTLIKYEFKDLNDTLFCLSGFSLKENKIYFYFVNKTNGEIKKNIVNLKSDNIHPFDYGYINKDSLFVIYSPAYNNDLHDSILFLMNNKGQIKQFYSFDNAPVLSKKNPQFENNDEAICWITNLYEPFNFKNGKLFLLFNTKASVLGDPAYENLPIAGYIDVKTNNFNVIPINYPDIEYGKTYFPSPFKDFYSVIGDRDKIIYAFKYTPKVIEFDLKTKKKQIHEIKSTVFDTVYSVLNEKYIPGGYDFDLPYPEYFKILYDKYRKQYYRVIFSTKEYGFKPLLIITDSSFNTIAEGFQTKRIIGFTKDYIVAFSKSPNKGKFYVTFNKLGFKKGTNKELIAEIKANKKDLKLINKPVTHYIKKNTNIKDKNYTAIFMYYEMCPKTRDFVLSFYQFNKERFQKNQIYLVLVTQSVIGLKSDLKRYSLLPESNSNVIIDSTYRFASYNGNNRNDLPRIVKVRDNKITADTVFITTNKDYSQKFQMFIINSGKEQMKLKDLK